MRRAFLTGITWLIVSFLLTAFLIRFSGSADVNTQIFLFVLSMILSWTSVLWIAQKLFPVQKNLLQKLNLSPSSGHISGDDLTPPSRNVSVRYRRALISPVVTHLYSDIGAYRGFLIDFGNGIAGFVDGTAVVNKIKGDLALKISSPDGEITYNYR